MMWWRALIFSWTILFAGSQAWAQETTPEHQPPLDEQAIRPNHFVPAFGIVAFDFLLNRYGYQFIDASTYDVNASSIRHNLVSPWVIDNDPFAINQFMHPYQGSVYHGLARSAGLNYWESLGYTFAGSILWEIAGETTPPSRNDQIASGIGGSFLGEPLFRLAELMLERGHQSPGFWRELAAAVISPPTGFNRLVYGNRFKGLYPSRNPASFTRVQFGVMGTASARNNLLQPLTRNVAVADFSVEYGMPGKPDYAYRRPFDYFNFQFTSSTGSRFESIFTRGLLAGASYGGDTGPSRGVWGLYGSYDYIAPEIFRISSTAVGLGTTFQRGISRSSALQGTVIAGVGYGAGGGLGGADENDHHYGLTPQLLGAVRLIPGQRAAFDVTVRDYYITHLASTHDRGSENVVRAEAMFSVSLATHHAVSVKYIWSRRDASATPDLGSIIQSRGTFGLFYTFLGGAHFGRVEF
jgi:hypothetical protein